MLQHVLDCQEKFQKVFGIDFSKMNDKERAKFVSEHGYCLMEEVVELLREMKYHKSWKNYDGWSKEKDAKQIELAKEEAIDSLAFLTNIFLALEMNQEEVLKRYNDKNDINHKRQQNNY